MEDLTKYEHRDLKDAPENYTAKAVKAWLVSKGAKGIISTNALSIIVGISKRVIKNAERAGKLKVIDKCTYQLSSVVDWLMENPRYLAQEEENYQVTPETLLHVKNILRQSSPRLIQLWNNDLEDLAAEVCFRMSKTRITSKAAESTIIMHAIANLWHEKSTQQRTQTVSWDEQEERRRNREK